MGKPFFYRINAADLLHAVVSTPEEERGNFALTLALDLVSGNPTIPFSKAIIREARAFSRQKSEAGKKGMQNRYLKSNTVITEPNTDITRSSNRSSKKNKISIGYVCSDGQTISYEEFFEKLWKSYPRKIGKDSAKKRFEKTVKTEKDMKDIYDALVHYRELTNGKDTDYIKHGNTWFNNWKDYIPAEEG